MKLVRPIPKTNLKTDGQKKPDPKKIKKFEFKIDLSPKKLLVWFLVIFFGLSFLSSVLRTGASSQTVDLTRVLTDIKEGKVKQVQVQNDRLIIFLNDGTQVAAEKETTQSFVQILKDSGIDPTSVEIKVVNQSISTVLADILGTILPLILMAVFFYFIFRQARGAQDSIFSFGQSRAKVFSKGKQAITFKDVAGVDEAKKELEEVVDFLKHPQKYRALGARTPKGVLLFGPSGVGKTLLAKAVAGEAGVPFFSMAGSEFMEMLVGVGASRVRDLFSTAKKAAPAIIFIDEIDAIGRQRGSGIMGGHDEREQTLNQILVEMDGFTPNDNVIIVAATNRGDLLDPALLRPGRFDRTVVLDMPDLEGRKAILQIHSKGKKYSPKVSWEKIAKRTVGFSGADLENMLNESAILAARLNKKEIEEGDVEEAAVKVKLGPERKRLQSDEDKKMTAYHEAGHAVVSFFSTHTDPVHRISIVARGMSLGHTLIAPLKDRSHETKTRLLEQIQVMMGGRAAEEMIFNEMTTGAANDIMHATKITKAMVINFGMSKLGPVFLGPQIDGDENGRSWYEPANLSPEMQAKVDREIGEITTSSYKSAQKILKDNKDKLDKIAKALLEKETLEEEEFEGLMK
ncbi:cell division protein FtsH [Candidatus Shapirobacteria bacterium CG09_land_8_20_14_0_10_39_12]|uniref:ATP-dependent zinc metalloprotease FtsH n=1 Tax=Candidatus Shapirobacteria bacterium CG09_land_8_20_14_0_10_39_12 TaxID=1974885 RepID=A0A2H0WQ64_9BACT|nr:MAG: cell division protein FtsH [Candidatus Shapirobacteria bacterium CG09_land_8_20_14_0_10_39_12]